MNYDFNILFLSTENSLFFSKIFKVGVFYQLKFKNFQVIYNNRVLLYFGNSLFVIKSNSKNIYRINNLFIPLSPFNQNFISLIIICENRFLFFKIKSSNKILYIRIQN